MQRIAFILTHYGALTLFLLACWGLGHGLLRRLYAESSRVDGLGHALALLLGQGLVIAALQGLGIAGALRPASVGSLLAVAAAMALWQARTLSRFETGWREAWRHRDRAERWAHTVVLLWVVSTLLVPLAPPLEWDELSYHLPLARQWAESGQIQPVTWLRYPWFPYNYDLLYAAALAVYDDIFTHFLHAAAGWLTAFLVYQVGVRYLDRLAAAVAVAIWFLLASGEFGNAYVDMGVTVFVFGAFLALQFWLEQPVQRGWLALAAFLLGVAMGSKYQALGYLPLALAVLLWRERKPATLLLATVCLALPSAYWYIRNLMATGDPFNPMGGPWLGFTNWNQEDFRLQLADVHMRAAWPHWSFLPTLALPWLPVLKASTAVRHGLGLGAYGVALWALTSRYDRYLMPLYPVLALLAAAGWVALYRALAARGNAWVARSGGLPMLRFMGRWAAMLLLMVLALAVVRKSWLSWDRVAAPAQARERLLHQQVTGYATWLALRKPEAQVGKIYQLGLEDAIYYAPNPVWGDHFGPFRYRDYATLPPRELAQRLRREGFDTLVVHNERWPGVDTAPDFARHFTKLREDGRVRVYRVLAPR